MFVIINYYIPSKYIGTECIPENNSGELINFNKFIFELYTWKVTTKVERNICKLYCYAKLFLNHYKMQHEKYQIICVWLCLKKTEL